MPKLTIEIDKADLARFFKTLNKLIKSPHGAAVMDGLTESLAKSMAPAKDVVIPLRRRTKPKRTKAK